LRPEIRGYIPITRRITLALRLAGGVLLAGYGGNLSGAVADTAPAQRTAQQEYLIARDTQILQFRGFFGGGPYSNRGYSQNAVNPHVFICADGTENCKNEKVYQLISTGGLAMWEASAEVRMPVAGDFGVTFFADSSDVTREITLRFTRPHFSVGVGARYQTPVGPLRADLGFRVPCMQVLENGCGDLASREQDPAVSSGALDEAPQDTFLGTDLPLQISIAIGETF
jgi:outer membrane protein insertion porin family/translocation and assembly module TamA